MAGFDWDEAKNAFNHEKHGVSFEQAGFAFSDPHRVLIRDDTHSQAEERWFCLGRVGGRVMTVRFTYRDHVIRIFGAAYWRKGEEIYAKENNKR